MPPRRIRPPSDRPKVTLFLDGQPVTAYEGEPLAAALLAAGHDLLGRSMKYHRPRGATCGTGHCSHCLVRLDGMPNVRSCQTPAREGQRIERQNVVGSAEHDLLAATDWLFPRGLDHHEMFTGVPVFRPVVDRVVRRLSGSGTLPDTPVASRPATDHEPDVLVVGAGTSGAAAARAAQDRGARVLLVEASATPGGRALTGLHGPSAPPSDLADFSAAGGELWTGAVATQIDREPGRLLVVVDRGDHLARVWPGVVVFASGGYPTLGLFENNDLPGVIHAGWAASLIERWGILPGERAVVCGDGEEADRVADLLMEAGGEIALRLPAAAALRLGAAEGVRLVGARGTRSVRGVAVERDGRTTEVDCDLVILALPTSPGFELSANAGANVRFDPQGGGFAVQADGEGRTAAKDVFVCGTLRGARALTEAAEEGARTGRVAAQAALERREVPHAS